jgi:hypothetical protein
MNPAPVIARSRGFLFSTSDHYPPMKELNHTSPASPNTSQEVLIERAITFRNSTFGALKHFMRDHERRTGQKLTNSAAVDMALRSYLAKHVHPDVMKAMHQQTAPHTRDALRYLPEDARETPAPAAPRVATSRPTIGVQVRPRVITAVRPVVTGDTSQSTHSDAQQQEGQA